MQVQRGHGPEGKGEKRKQTATQKIKMKIRKFHSGTNVTAQSRVAEQPLMTGTRLFVCEQRPWMDVTSLEKGSAGCPMLLTDPLATADPGQEEEEEDEEQRLVVRGFTTS